MLVSSSLSIPSKSYLPLTCSPFLRKDGYWSERYSIIGKECQVPSGRVSSIVMWLVERALRLRRLWSSAEPTQIDVHVVQIFVLRPTLSYYSEGMHDVRTE